MPGPASARRRQKRERLESWALLTAVLVASVSGITYELLLGTTASFLLGDTVREWSLTIGVFLAAMGLGSWLSRFVALPATKDGEEEVSTLALLKPLLVTEIGMALLGGFSGLGLFAVYAWAEPMFRPVFYVVVALLGGGVGLEVPLLARAIGRYGNLRETLSSVFGVDYGGALLASVLFPLVLYPTLGVARTAMVASLFNLTGAVLIVATLRVPAGGDFGRRVYRPGVFAILFAMVAIVLGLVFASGLTQRVDDALFWPEEIVYAEQSEYQRLALTRHPEGDSVQLYLNGHLQFSSRDEVRYHESLVHVPAALGTSAPRTALVLGGGDGLVVRELRLLGVSEIVLVDRDPMVTELAQRHPLLTELNEGAFDGEGLTVVHDDALEWLRHTEARFDLIVLDLPDPSTPGLARLYSVQMYRLVAHALSDEGVAVVQAGSPYYAREAYWCIDATLRAAGLHTLPYRTNVPSFGEWGFVAASRRPIEAPHTLRLHDLDYLTEAVLPTLFVFPNDMARTEQAPHTLLQPTLPALFTEGWLRRGS